MKVLTKDNAIIEIEQTPNLDLTITPGRPWGGPRSPQPPWENSCIAAQNFTLEAPDQVAYDQRMGLQSKKYLTTIRASDCQWIVDRIRDQITGKVVIELGAGIGVMATALAGLARHVYALEADPMWSWVFARHLYQSKPTNLTYILDRAENLVDIIKADVAICLTGSDDVNLRALCERFAPVVFMPWQDWNDGKAVTHWMERHG